ncbi:MAG: HAD family hydrolase, partial [Terriglobales bacterium]
MLDFSRFSHLTFDCYGTLIDWESGILSAVKPILGAHLNEVAPDDEILDLYGVIEAEIEAGPYRRYREVLQQVVRSLGGRFGFVPSVAECASLPESLKEWLPFLDTKKSLRSLAARYKLVIVSNIDDDLMASTLPKLGVDFAEVITAEQARSYKPSSNNFRIALERMGV